MQFPSNRGIARAVVLLAAALSITACKSTGDTRPTEVDSKIYDVKHLHQAFVAKGIKAEAEADKVVARYEDMGVVVLSVPLPDSGLIRMYTVWLKDPEVELTVEWLFKVNLQNRDGIIKVYLDEDDDVITEWYAEVHAGLSADAVVESARIFAMRSYSVARAIADFLK
jgi:hypothetical protein